MKYNHIFQLGKQGNIRIVITNELKGQIGDEEAGKLIPQEVVDLYGGCSCGSANAWK